MSYFYEILFIISVLGFLFIYGRNGVPVIIILSLTGILNEILKAAVPVGLVRAIIVIAFLYIALVFWMKWFKKSKNSKPKKNIKNKKK